MMEDERAWDIQEQKDLESAQIQCKKSTLDTGKVMVIRSLNDDVAGLDVERVSQTFPRIPNKVMVWK